MTAADSPQAWHLQALNDLIKNMDESIAKLEPAPGDTTNTADIGFDTPVIPSAAFSSAGMNLLGVARASEKERGVSDELANNPVAADDFLSRAAGMTQSETSIAWCGKNAVVGFNDSGSYVATLVLNPSPSPSFSYSFTGWSVSHDAGNTFTDRGILLSDPLIDPPGTIHFRDLFGDPVVRCTDSSTFYFINIAADTFIQFTPSFTFQARSGVSISRSTDGGNNFGGAAMAVAKSGFTHFIDKPWLAVSPGATRASDTIVVTYTDFDFSGTSTTCPRQLRTAIESVRSTDGGATWSSPVVLDTVCGFSPAVQGALVATGLGKDVFVAWERFANFPEGARDVRIRKSADGGATFGPASIVSSVNPIGNGFYLQGHFRAFIDLQGLAVDTSGGPNSGAVYVSWHDGRNKKRSDVFGYCPLRNRFGRCIAPRVYFFGDILLARSTDGAATFAAPVRVNDDPVTSAVDQYLPSLAVDREGTVFVAFYDRRADPRNFLIDTFLAVSENGGRFKNRRLTEQSFAAVTGWQDMVVNPSYMGDYVAVAADATGEKGGIIAAWGDNSLGDANVAFTKRSGGD